MLLQKWIKEKKKNKMLTHAVVTQKSEPQRDGGQGCWYRSVPVGTAGILRTGRWTGTKTPSKCITQDTGLYWTIPAVPEYTGRFGRKREIWPVQKLKGKIEEMHDLNKLQCSKLPPHWHHRSDLLLPFFFLLIVCCPSPLLWFLLFFCWTMNIAMRYLLLCFVLFEIS